MQFRKLFRKLMLPSKHHFTWKLSIEMREGITTAETVWFQSGLRNLMVKETFVTLLTRIAGVNSYYRGKYSIKLD